MHRAVEQEPAGWIHEIFCSIQGEGLWAGRLQHFVRFQGCTAGCRFCDTPGARLPGMGGEGKENRADRGQRMTAAAVIAAIEAQERSRPGAQAIAITGGEPLEQAEFLAVLLRRVRAAPAGQAILLETAGLHAEEMERVAGLVDMVSMDFKLPGPSGLTDAAPRHARFLRVLQPGAFYVKAIVDPETPAAEVRAAAVAVRAVDAGAPFFLQPAARNGRVLGGAYLLDLWSAAREHLTDVRVMPQVHRALSLR